MTYKPVPNAHAKLLQEILDDPEAKALYKAALQIDKDYKLRKEMKDWDIMINDGLENIEKKDV